MTKLFILLKIIIFSTYGYSQVENQQFRKSLVVVTGGFSSCPNDLFFDKVMRAGKTEEMYSEFFDRALPQAIRDKSGHFPAIFSICYTGPDKLALNFTTMIEGRYAWNLGRLDKNIPSVDSFQIPQGTLLNNTNFLSHVKFEIQSYIKKKSENGIEVDLYIIGHSYGGFTGIQLADYFSHNFKGLITIDPISMLNCQAPDMATKIYSTVTLKHPGCQTYPRDNISITSIRAIQKNIAKSNNQKWWFNTYQRSFPWLRSDAFNKRDIQEEIISLNDFNNILVDGDYHSQMGRNNKVWDFIEQLF